MVPNEPVIELFTEWRRFFHSPNAVSKRMKSLPSDETTQIQNRGAVATGSVRATFNQHKIWFSYDLSGPERTRSLPLLGSIIEWCVVRCVARTNPVAISPRLYN